MKKKYFSCICLLVLCMIGMTGCGSQMPNMTDTQRKEISEYAAQMLLKYNSADTSRLVDLDALAEPTPRPQITASPVENGGMDETEDTPIINPGEELPPAQLEPKVVLGLPDVISLQYSDYQIVDSYTDVLNSGLKIEAEEGNKLLICNFVLINDGASKQSIDMLKDSISYVMQIGEDNKQCSVTMLSNDLTTYVGILDADESRKVVVITEYDEEKLNVAESIYLKIQKDKNKTSIQIK